MEKWRLDILREEKGVDPNIISVPQKNIILSIFPELQYTNTEKWKIVESWMTDLNRIGLIDNDLKFNFENFLRKQKILSTHHIYLSYNFFNEDNIDLLCFEDFCKYFIYFWYPLADNLTIVSEEYKWRIFIHHEGDIFIS